MVFDFAFLVLLKLNVKLLPVCPQIIFKNLLETFPAFESNMKGIYALLDTIVTLPSK